MAEHRIFVTFIIIVCQQHEEKRYEFFCGYIRSLATLTKPLR